MKAYEMVWNLALMKVLKMGRMTVELTGHEMYWVQLMEMKIQKALVKSMARHLALSRQKEQTILMAGPTGQLKLRVQMSQWGHSRVEKS